MDSPYLGEIRSIAFGYAPKGWALCNGQLLPVNQNQALFSLLGTTYGGNGTTTFALPNLQGRVPVGTGQGTNLSNYPLGAALGNESVTLLQTQIPQHTHPVVGTLTPGNSPQDTTPAGNYPASGGLNAFNPGPKNVAMLPANSISGMTGMTGGNQTHENRQPYLATNFVIALQGIYPSRP